MYFGREAADSFRCFCNFPENGIISEGVSTVLRVFQNQQFYPTFTIIFTWFPGIPSGALPSPPAKILCQRFFGNLVCWEMERQKLLSFTLQCHSLSCNWENQKSSSANIKRNGQVALGNLEIQCNNLLHWK